jgi:MFS family permease
MIITPLYLVEKDISVPLITIIIGIGNLPWIFKFFLGGVIDYFINKGRKIFTVYGSLISITCLFLIAISDYNFYLILYSILIIIGYIGICFIDVSADAWVIEITKKEERGKINGIMNVGRALGTSIGAIILTIVADIYDFMTTFLLAGLIILLFLLFPLLTKKDKVIVKDYKLLNILKKEFKNPINQLSSIYFFIVALNPGLIGAIIILYANIVLDLSTTQIGLLSSALLIFIIPGSIIGGIITDKFGRKKTLYFLIGLNIVFSALLIFTYNWIFLFIIYGLFSFVTGGLAAANSSLMMDMTNKEIGATQFSLYSSIFNAGFVITAAIGGTLVEAFDFSIVFILSGLLLVPAVFVLYKIKKRESKKAMI